MPLELARTTAETLSRLHHFLHGNGDTQTLDPAHPANAAQPFRHSYYAPDQFFQKQTGSGVIQTLYGQRVLRVTTLFVESLVHSLQSVLGVEAGQALYQIGFQFGQQEMDAFVPRVEREFDVPFDKMHLGVLLETWWWPFRAKGWGDWRCNLEQIGSGLILVDVFDSIVAAALGQTGKCSCHLYAGIFAALFSRIAGRELACVELQCASAGAKHCQFLIAVSKRVDAATIWRERGANAATILKDLKGT
ncbi:MAG TPA: V4R domain-containing protein [Gemmataceae bacterium]|nr:V4R domain-containing protein [Gemmataceae bacterium]